MLAAYERDRNNVIEREEKKKEIQRTNIYNSNVRQVKRD